MPLPKANMANQRGRCPSIRSVQFTPSRATELPQGRAFIENARPGRGRFAAHVNGITWSLQLPLPPQRKRSSPRWKGGKQPPPRRVTSHTPKGGELRLGQRKAQGIPSLHSLQYWPPKRVARFLHSAVRMKGAWEVTCTC